VSALEIKDFDSLLIALRARHDFFHSHGCRVSDHGIETAYAEDYRDSEIRFIFKNSRKEKVWMQSRY
jgi:glucuronate isomerase